MFLKSFLKKKTTTMRVPMCRAISKRKGVERLKKYSKILRWPVLDIGSHSVKPWIMPRIIVSMSFSNVFSPLFCSFYFLTET